MAAPIPADVRAAVEADLRHGQGVNQTAKRHGVSAMSVSRILRSMEAREGRLGPAGRLVAATLQTAAHGPP